MEEGASGAVGVEVLVGVEEGGEHRIKNSATSAGRGVGITEGEEGYVLRVIRVSVHVGGDEEEEWVRGANRGMRKWSAHILEWTVVVAQDGWGILIEMKEAEGGMASV